VTRGDHVDWHRFVKRPSCSIDAKDNVAVAVRDLDGEVRVRIGESVHAMRIVAHIPRATS
jgi:hypothetical protein